MGALEFSIVLADGTPQALTLEGRPADPESCYLLQTVAGHEARELRESVAPVPDGDGSYLGPQAREGITLAIAGITVGSSRADRAERDRALRALLGGGVRGNRLAVRLVGVEGYDEDLVAVMRVAQRITAPRDGAEAGRQRLQPWQFGLRAEEAAWSGAQIHVQELAPLSSVAGISFPIVFPISFAGASDPGTAVTNDGDDLAWPALRITGPCAGPVLENLTTGEQLVLDVVLAAGEWLDIDPRPGHRSILLGGDPEASRYSALDGGESSWWGLVAGPNVIRVRAESFSAGALLTLSWRSAYL